MIRLVVAFALIGLAAAEWAPWWLVVGGPVVAVALALTVDPEEVPWL